MKLALAQIRRILGDPFEDKDATHADDANTTAQGYSIDSRTAKAGELFFAVRGERLDGHAFVAEVLKKGALAAVVARARLKEFGDLPRAQLVLVEDTLDALQKLAREVRRLWGGRVVGVTGSAGKTTTKEAIAQVLGTRFYVLKSEGNLNNHFGLPLQLLKVEAEHEFAVLEMGMSSAGEIAALAVIAEPDWGVVNTVAAVHTEFFADGIEGVARAKRELIEALPAAGVAFLNADDVRVDAMAAHARCKVVRFGRMDRADVRAGDVQNLGAEGLRFDLLAHGEKVPVQLHLLGEHNIANVLAAAAVCVEAGLSPQQISDALAEIQPAANRGQMLRFRGAFLINDCYNSNPRALDAMVDALAAIPAGRRIVVAGEMLELGADAVAMHAACGRYAAELGVDILLGVRGNARAMVSEATAAGMEAIFFPTPEDAGDWLAMNLREGDAVLLKASRGVKLEGALQRLYDAV